MSSISGSQNQITYHCNDGVITRADRKNQEFQTRNFRTENWQATRDVRLIQKMMMGKGEVTKEKAEQLFRSIQNNQTHTPPNQTPQLRRA